MKRDFSAEKLAAAQALESVKQEHDSKLEQVKKENTKNLQTFKKEHKKDIDALKRENQAVKSQHEKLKT